MSMFCQFIVILSLLGATSSQASYTDDPKKKLEDFNLTSLETKDAEKFYIEVPEIYIKISNGTSIRMGNAKKSYKDDPNKFDFNQIFSGIKTARKNLSKLCDIKKSSNILKVQHDVFKECISIHINGSEVQTELQDCRKKAPIDMILKKNCGKSPLIHKCVEHAKLMVKRCLTYSDEKFYNQTIDIVKNIQAFLCLSSDGFMLSKLVTKGGVQCFLAQFQGIKNCFNETIYPDFPRTVDFLTTTLSMILYTSRDSRCHCKDFEKTRHCVNQVFKKCPNNPAASIVDAFFKYLKGQINCDINLDISKNLWYFFALYVILMYFYFYLIMKQKFEVTSSETPPKV